MSPAKLAGRAVLVSALTITLVPVLGASPAFACSCAMATDKQHYKSADVVFKGTLRKTTPPKARPDGSSSSMGRHGLRVPRQPRLQGQGHQPVSASPPP